MPELPKKIHLSIVTPDRLLFEGDVDGVTVPGLDGYLGILPGHAPLLSELRVGMISYPQEAQVSFLYCSWGFIEVLPHRVSVLTEVAERPEEIDIEQARNDKQRAEQLLRSKDPHTDYQAARVLWEQSWNRLEVAQKAVIRDS